MQDKEILVTIQKAINASPQLRSKKQLIEMFLGSINNVDDVVTAWNGFVEQQREDDLETIIELTSDNSKLYNELSEMLKGIKYE